VIRFEVSEDNQWLVLRHYDEDIEKKQIELSLTRKIHNFYFHPLVKKKLWDGNICFVDKKGPFWRIGIGLWSELYKIADEYNLKMKIEGIERIIDSELTLEIFQNFVEDFFRGKQIKPRDYQIEAAWKIVRFRYSVSEIATSSGKTLIAFMILAYLKKVKKINKFLIIVPNTNLVIQGTEDFENYGIKDLGDIKIGQLGGGNKLREGANIIIGTYQSIIKQEKDFFEGVDAVFVDEAHLSNTASIKKILSNCLTSGWRFGLTGTLTKRESAEFLTTQQFLGPLVLEISPNFLFVNKYATPINVKIVKLNWMEPEFKEKLYNLRSSQSTVDGKDLYNIERKLLLDSDVRISFIIDMICKTTKNSLVLFNSVGSGYGKKIYNSIREKDSTKEVFYIDGDCEIDNREYIIDKMREGENRILVASTGTLSTGISINNLYNIFLAEAYKSEILVKQIIGRGMRLHGGKMMVNIVDFVDDMSFNGNNNYLMKHSLERIEIYKKENFYYKIYEVNLLD
jgi:superfamily II DNA or RNA helicase